jgi:endogenous inhibitor of DNA gyrase (YacG/DUF329 family)
LTASDPSAYRFRPSNEAFFHRSALMSQGFTLDHKPLPLEKLTGEYAEEPAPKPAPAALEVPAPPVPMGQCAHCQKQLPRRARADAKFCSSACKQADFRARKLKDEAHKAFKTDTQIAQNNHDIDLEQEHYQNLAMELNSKASLCGIKGVKFFGTLLGVLAVEEIPGTAPLAISTINGELTKAIDCFYLSDSVYYMVDMTDRRTGEPEVIEALLRKTSNLSFRYKDHERECRDLLKGPERQVYLFTRSVRFKRPLPMFQSWNYSIIEDEAEFWQRLCNYSIVEPDD